MSISEPFIRRPIATSLLMLGVLVFGIVAYALLPIAALPQVDFPTITVTANYPGASPATMASAIATPLEQQFTAIPSLAQMTSLSGTGTTTITLQFDLSPQHRRRGAGRADRDQGRERIAAEGPAEPADLQEGQPGRLSGADLRGPFRRGAGLQAGRLRLHDPGAAAFDRARRVAGLGVRPEAICRARRDQSRRAGRARHRPGGRAQRAGGGDGQRARRARSKARIRPRRWTPTTSSSMPRSTATSSSPTATARRCGSRMSASAVDSVQNLYVGAWFNNQPAEGVAIQRAPGANTIDLVNRIKAMMPHLEQSIPPSVHVELMSDRSLITEAAVHDVQITMIITIALVVLVIFIFLRTVWATIIPSMAVPLSLLATAGIMYARRLQPRQHFADGADDLGRLRGGRRDRDDREHRALHRTGRAAVPGGAARRGADRLHHHFDHLLADRGVHSAVLHGRHHRPAVPRIRGHRVGRGGGVGGGVADPDAGDVLAVPEARGPSITAAGSTGWRSAFFNWMLRRLRSRPALRVPPPVPDAADDAVADRASPAICT